MRRVHLQRLFGGAVLLLAVALLLPKAWGFVSATVGLQQSTTFYPAVDTTQTEVVVCQQANVFQQMDANVNYIGSYFKCTNNWVAPVTVTLNVLNANGTGMVLTGHTGTIPAGATACVPGTRMRATTAKAGVVSYQVTVDQPDLFASLAFVGGVWVQNGSGRTPTPC